MRINSGIKNGKKANYIFLFLGLLSLALSFFDFYLEYDFYGGLLAVAWGLLFLYLAFKKDLEIRLSQKTVTFFQAILIIFVIISGLLKILFKLKAFN